MDNWNITNIAYSLYVEDNKRKWSKVTDWWIEKDKPSYKKYIRLAELKLRMQKINKIICRQ